MSRRRWGRVLGAIGLLGMAVMVVAFATLDRWLFIALDPGPFDSTKTPAAPDYSKDTSWAALPTMDDDADVFLKELPAVSSGAAYADVFYVHPTTSLAKRWNAPIDEPEVIRATARGGTLIQASAFNACCAVYAPRYRQANGKAFVDANDDGNKAIDVAYSDVAAAFEAFLERRGAGRPFILASHSQGTVVAERLLREKIWGKSIAKDFVVGYLIGGPITRETLGADIPVCNSESQWGCVVAYNVRGPRYQENALEFKNRDGTGTSRSMASRICVNPLTWKNDDVLAPVEKHQGAVFFDAETPAVLPAFTDGTCKDGKLLIQHMEKLPERDFASDLLLHVTGPDNYHPIEVQLFYVNLRNNAVGRVEAFRAAHRETRP
ncbi:MAG: DUF3089 domain-containing protein [Polyangiaceae bacterium]|nr:DUF3089 domain-containing protein [Polyangiaceae bacterium]